MQNKEDLSLFFARKTFSQVKEKQKIVFLLNRKEKYGCSIVFTSKDDTLLDILSTAATHELNSLSKLVLEQGDFKDVKSVSISKSIWLAIASELSAGKIAQFKLYLTSGKENRPTEVGQVSILKHIALPDDKENRDGNSNNARVVRHSRARLFSEPYNGNPNRNLRHPDSFYPDTRDACPMQS